MSDADVNAKLNGIVTLLKAVGVDGGKGGKNLDDHQIQAIIRKLQSAQAEAPQIIAALEAHSNRQAEPPQPQYDDDEEEEDDDDANYPMVGPGCSDDISVVSDLTTPTVVSSLNVPDEEHYKDTLPPMIVGSMLIAPTKRKNLVNTARNNVRKGGVGGAAAQRRKHYNATMEKLKTEKSEKKAATAAPAPKPKQPSPKPAKSKKKAARRASLGAADADKGNAFTNSWNAFESNTLPKKETPSTLIDDDGFLMSSGAEFEAFDPFQDTNFGAKTPNSTSTKKKTKKKASKSSSNNSTGTGSGKPRRTRRASLAM